MATHRIQSFYDCGQSIWLDYIRRDLMTSGTLKKMVADGVITGMTSNPTIFEKAISAGADYDAQIRQLLDQQPDLSDEALFEALAIQDIQMAADELRPVYDRTGGADGYVSLEVSPRLAHDSAGTLADARRLFRQVNRPNLMIKIPATAAGLPAITAAISEGININVTLMFSLADYDRVADAYLAGLERRVAAGQSPSGIASVASFFVSRVDTVVDGQLPKDSPLRGRIAVANAKLAYERFEQTFQSARYRALLPEAAIQRILWGSTGAKNPAYSDLLYVEPLVGPHSVNTVPTQTLDAILDHGTAAAGAVTSGREQARAQFQALADLGIHLDEVTNQLQRDGVKSFSDSFDSLMKTLAGKRAALAAA
jgi:transaldolase